MDKTGSRKEYKCLMIMPPFSMHAHRRNWDRLEDFYNPEKVFKEVHIISLEDDYNYTTTRFGSLTIYPIKTNTHLLNLSQTLYFLYYNIYKTAKKTYQIAKNEKIDLLIQRYGGPVYHGFPIVFVGNILKVKSVITIQNDYEYERKNISNTLKYKLSLFRLLKDFILNYVVRRATHIWAVSEYITRYWINKGINKSNIVVIPNKEIISKFKDKPEKKEVDDFQNKYFSQIVLSESIIVSTVGRIIPQKNLENMVKAFKNAAGQKKNTYFIIIGKGPLKDDLVALTKRLKISDKVFLCPYLTHNDLKILYHISTVFLFPTLFEGQGRVIYEALACGLPVISSNYGPQTEMIIDNVNGFLVNPLEPLEISKVLLRALNENRLKRRMFDSCLKAAYKYDLDVVNRQEAEFYTNLLKQ